MTLEFYFFVACTCNESRIPYRCAVCGLMSAARANGMKVMNTLLVSLSCGLTLFVIFDIGQAQQMDLSAPARKHKLSIG